MKKTSTLSLQKQINRLKSKITEQQMTIDVILDSLKAHDYKLFKAVDMALNDTKLNNSYLKNAVIKLSDDLDEKKTL